MIKKNNKKLVFKGTAGELAKEYRLITEGMVGVFEKVGLTREEAIERVKEIQRHGLMTKKELIQEELDKLETVLSKIFSPDDDGEKYKVWCETNEIRDKVLVALENRGVKWAIDGKKPIEMNEAPMGFIVDDGLWQTEEEQKANFDRLKFEELKAEDLIKEAEGDE